MTNSLNLLVKFDSLIVSFFFNFFTILSTLFFLFPGKANGCCERFYNRELPSPTCCCSSVVISVNLSFTLEFKTDLIKGVSSAKISHSVAAVEIL